MEYTQKKNYLIQFFEKREQEKPVQIERHLISGKKRLNYIKKQRLFAS